jgi:hypothetical protein
MAREFSAAFYRSKQWKKCRGSYIAHRVAIDGGLCESCHDRIGVIVHHDKEWITPDNINNPDVTLNFDNLKLDCLICHNKEKENGESERYFFGEDGQVYPTPPIKNIPG